MPMSVPKGKRKDAYSKFEQKMIELHRETAARTQNVPARYQKLLNPPIAYCMNIAYLSVLRADEVRPKTAEKIKERNDLLQKSADALSKLQKPLWTFWNIREYEDRQMAYWSGKINEEILILTNLAGGKTELIQTINRKNLREMMFLDDMSQLQRFTYQKIAHVPQRYYDYISRDILECINCAWYAVLQGNSIIPENRGDVEARRKWLQYAMDYLNAMQRPLYALWNVMNFSENVMDEWAGMIDTELRLLHGVMESDRQRYCDLEVERNEQLMKK